MAANMYYSCNEPSIVGIDLLDDETINTHFTDTISFTAHTTPARPVLTSRLAAQTYYAGNLNDPIFGSTEAAVLLAVQRITNFDSIQGASLDSMVLRIAYDTLGFYGNHSNARYDYALFSTTSPIGNDSLFTNSIIPFEIDPIATAFNRTANAVDSFFINMHATGEPVKIGPEFRLRLNTTFEEELFSVLQNSESDADLQAFLPGLCLKIFTPHNAMVGFNLSPAARTGNINSLRIYYETAGGKKFIHDLFFRTGRYNSVGHIYNGATVQPFINNPNPSEDLLFVQGGGGVETKINLTPLLTLKDKLINRAEIELTVVEEERFLTSLFTPLNRFWALHSVNEQLRAIPDFNFIPSFGEGIFEGSVKEVETDDGTKIKKLTFNITNHLQRLLKNPDGISKELILSSFPEGERPGRIVFYGPTHPMYPAKFNIFFTSSSK